MKKIFISQPMKGKTDEEILAERRKAVRSAERQLGEPVEVIDSFFQSAPAGAKPLWLVSGKVSGTVIRSRYCLFCKGMEGSQGMQD